MSVLIAKLGVEVLEGRGNSLTDAELVKVSDALDNLDMVGIVINYLRDKCPILAERLHYRTID